MIEKHTARQVKQEISRVLWEVWDPIGVNRFPEARDEYDSYVNDLYIALLNGASDEELARQLFNIAAGNMGLSGAALGHMTPIVAALREIPLPKNTK